jgi:NAD(P)H-nitrite reductase large subunit
MRDDDLIICRCEEITKKEIIDVIQQCGCRTIDEVKRLTRAGMGPCQWRTCEKAIARILHSLTGIPLHELTPCTVQFPVRPIKMNAIITSMNAEQIQVLEAKRKQSPDKRH